jgi:hypothetical protein
MAAPPMVHRRKRLRGTFISTQRGCSFVLEVGGSDDRPPFLDLGLLLRGNPTFTSVQTALK